MRVSLRGVQVIPFIEDACQSKMRFPDDLLGMIPRPSQHASVRLGRQVEFVVQFLHVPYANGRQDQREHRPGAFAEGDGLHKRLPCQSPLALEDVGVSQRPVGVGALEQAVRTQILQRAA